MGACLIHSKTNLKKNRTPPSPSNPRIPVEQKPNIAIPLQQSEIVAHQQPAPLEIMEKQKTIKQSEKMIEPQEREVQITTKPQENLLVQQPEKITAKQPDDPIEESIQSVKDYFNGLGHQTHGDEVFEKLARKRIQIPIT